MAPTASSTPCLARNDGEDSPSPLRALPLISSLLAWAVAAQGADELSNDQRGPMTPALVQSAYLKATNTFWFT